MYENHNSENVVLNKDPQRLRLATTSSSVVPGTDLKRLKLLIRRTGLEIFFLGGGRTRTFGGGGVREHVPSENFEKWGLFNAISCVLVWVLCMEQVTNEKKMLKILVKQNPNRKILRLSGKELITRITVVMTYT